MRALGDVDTDSRVRVYGFVAVILAYVGASAYVTAAVFPKEPLLDYGIGRTAYSSLWAGPIGGLRDLRGPGAYFGVLGYVLSSGILLWMIRGAFVAERRHARVWCMVSAVAWWFLAGAVFFGPGP